eukprot:9369522-Pyramimonas_sp.AAC.1
MRLLAKRRRVQDVDDKEPQSKPGCSEGSQPETASAGGDGAEATSEPLGQVAEGQVSRPEQQAQFAS